jgi:hypothetical protein
MAAMRPPGIALRHLGDAERLTPFYPVLIFLSVAFTDKKERLSRFGVSRAKIDN